MRQISDETPPSSGTPCSGSSPARPSARSACAKSGGTPRSSALDVMSQSSPISTPRLERRASARAALRLDQLHERVQGLVRRCVDAELGPAPRDEAVEVVDLAALA